VRAGGNAAVLHEEVVVATDFNHRVRYGVPATHRDLGQRDVRCGPENHSQPSFHFDIIRRNRKVPEGGGVKIRTVRAHPKLVCVAPQIEIHAARVFVRDRDLHVHAQRPFAARNLHQLRIADRHLGRDAAHSIRKHMMQFRQRDAVKQAVDRAGHMVVDQILQADAIHTAEHLQQVRRLGRIPETRVLQDPRHVSREIPRLADARQLVGDTPDAAREHVLHPRAQCGRRQIARQRNVSQFRAGEHHPVFK
jgi:hypothetical protein